MNILWISGRHRHGEALAFAEPIAKLLSGLGHTLTYWSWAGDPPWIPDGFSIHLDPWPPLTGLFSRIPLMGALRRRVLDYDIVLCEQDLLHEFLVVEVVAGMRNRPRLWLLATYALGHYLAGRGEALSKRPRRLAETLYPRFDRIVTMATGVADDLVSRFRIPAPRVVTVPWPAPCLLSQAPAFAPPTVAVMGEITGIKGVEMLVQVLKLFSDDGFPVKLLILGDGPRLPDVVNLARSMAVPVEAAPLTPAFPDRLQEASVFHAPQWLDGTSWDIVTAAAAGLPVTAVNAPDAPIEVTVRGTLGKLVGLGDLDALHTVLHPLLTDEESWAGYHRAAAMLARRHAPERVSPQWEQLFTGIRNA